MIMVTLSSRLSCPYTNPPPQVLTSEYSVLLAQEFNRNPVINDAAAFDIYPL